MKKNYLIIIITICAFNFQGLFAQMMLKEVSLKKQIENSSLVVEGKVISKKSFWDAENKYIYTANTVEVYKVFKGEILSTIDVITLGGTVGLTALNVSHNLILRRGDIGVFILEESNIKNSLSNKSIKKQFRPYGTAQGFYKYNIYDDLAVNPFNTKKGISNTFYKEIINLTKKPITEMVKYDVGALTSKFNQINKTQAPTAIAFSPTTVTAGTKTTITITIANGATGDFGSTKGKVSFSDADEGGNGNYIDALDTQVNWSINSITVEVPSEAGTGKIRVTNNDASVRVSTTDLTVTSSEINVVYDADDTTDGMGGGSNGPLPAYAYRVQHIGQNGNGGYTWEMQTDFFNDSPRTGAKAAFKRAFDNWVCSTGINWTIKSTPTTVDVAEFESEPPTNAPPVNVIRFDNGELDANTLGTCYSWYKGCSLGGDNYQWFVAEMDIVFNDDVDWNFGPEPTVIEGKYDFESVALHELGHGHQLGHVINTNEVMHYSLNFNEDFRVLSVQDVSAASSIQSRSTSTFVCVSQPKMTNASCPLNVEEEELNTAINIYPNPSKGEFYIKNTGPVNLDKVVVYDVRGRLISQYDMSNASRTKTINLFGVSKGMYFVKIISERAEITRKILID